MTLPIANGHPGSARMTLPIANGHPGSARMTLPCRHDGFTYCIDKHLNPPVDLKQAHHQQSEQEQRGQLPEQNRIALVQGKGTGGDTLAAAFR